ncbi:MAG: ATP synthase F1 subunit delta [Candidatus Acidiferrales bacterium]
MKALAQRYAAALADVAIERNSAPQVRQDIAAFAGLMDESRELRQLLANPAVPRAGKHAVIESLVERLGSSRTVRNFLLLLVDHRRAALLPDIELAYESLLDAKLGLTRAVVTTGQELGAAERAELIGALERLVGGRVEAQFLVDDHMLGGVRVRVGSTIYDGSVRGQLNKLRARLASE